MKLGNPFKNIGKALGRFHLTIFIVIIASGVAGAILLLNMTLVDSTVSDGYVSQVDGGTIDQDTLDRLSSLHASGETLPELSLPSGRINPFAE